jgi:hypothetical protein
LARQVACISVIYASQQVVLLAGKNHADAGCYMRPDCLVWRTYKQAAENMLAALLDATGRSSTQQAGSEHAAS